MPNKKICKVAVIGGGNSGVEAAIDEAMLLKPKGHDFVIDRRVNRPALSRHMSVTGG